MNSFDPQRQDSSLKRRWQDRRQIITGAPSNSSSLAFYANNSNNTSSMAKYSNKFQSFSVLEDDDLVSSVVPAVTVVLEGRSICQRISLHNHASYQSLAKALRQMFVDVSDAGGNSEIHDDLDLSNAIPGHVIAYEDMENDLLLAGDLSWKDFVRVAKRIRILPIKGNSRKGTHTTSTREA
ncbi:auxin-responsive protein IAA33 [Gastrolobium bilobum]|uniref:auxin-responsive protein IAA33 n=1 Tax=Gastrolobium bilobum TaxID=150636 RepID=UPI002AAF5B9A|nr:auxin-responsive protein IAA33 [Gastrolobium bilobum]